ncbi:thioredoxin domain-containing protein [Flavobacterium sp. J49]|uniref:thioredoxin domain-containing protein n=1 Tax=Flavobacterium sp. J49 TaxID=2718534 RepID=UPI001593AD89|nr:thioredoxin domain-containing protein [Flavobacterium sp. J49]MBF6641139.1 thioredoxin domain-containing protein [Flavobacterium sp. J49]NIC02386.1 thioredoxin domain-containing protein [Flavobacterium sp. J49]
MNELHLETSPYLLQHANNPVHWKAWNEKSLAEAKATNKLIIISIGYSSCHWCHVMEHESFENDEVAAVMNTHFINIKIDREERPDIDAVYMKAVQVMTGRGGWPMNVVALPDGRPIWGGTYFRKNDWINSLEKLQEIYTQNPETIYDYAQQLHEGLQSISVIPKTETASDFNFDVLETLLEKWQKSFDWDFGGMARAPKFMMPTNYEFLLRYGYQTQNQNLLDFTNLTLTKMAYGGLFDTVDGGFSRYSVDMKWHVPHFEKMLYDNGQLVALYANAYKLTQNPLYKEVIEKTLFFVEKEWLTAEGSFYSALDADSLNAENHLEEGAFYVWTKEALQKLISEDFDLFSEVFNINEFGHWEHGNYVLIQNESLATIAEKQNMPLETLAQKKKTWEQKLYTEREKRSKPRLDDKCLTSWNAIMSKGFVEAYKALGDSKYLDIALQNAHFITKKLWSTEGHLFRTYKNGTRGAAEQSAAKATINAYLEDYAQVIQAFISLYEVTLDEQWLQNAKQLTDYCFDHFYDANAEFFSFTSKTDEALITAYFEVEDNVIPAANSVMAGNLFQLGIYFNNRYYESIAKQMVQNIIPTIDYPSAFSNWLKVLLNYSEQNKELAICGEKALDYLIQINQKYLPNIIVAGTVNNTKLPFLESRFVENQTLFYLCQNKTCDLPSIDFQEIIKEITINS